MVDYTPEIMQKRFHQNRAQRAEIIAASEPLRAQRDALVLAHKQELDALNAQIVEAEKGLFDLDTEAGILVRALNGKTGIAQ